MTTVPMSVDARMNTTLAESVKKMKKLGINKSMHEYNLSGISDKEFILMASDETLDWCSKLQTGGITSMNIIDTFNTTLSRGMTVAQAYYACEFIFRKTLHKYNLKTSENNK